jgi:DNA-binding NarL/FixJ family response regulator
MSPLTRSDKERSANGSEKPFYDRPNVDLLSGKQWQYVKRCYRLSPREIEVAKLICCGFGNEEVAGHLKITGGTVKTHLRNIYRRVRVNRKIELLLRFVEMTAGLYAKEPVAKDSMRDQGQRQAGLRDSSGHQLQRG